MVLAFPIGWTMSQIILTTMFFGLFTPIGFAFQLLGRDTLQRRHRGELDSYWQHKPVSADLSRYLNSSDLRLSATDHLHHSDIAKMSDTTSKVPSEFEKAAAEVEGEA